MRYKDALIVIKESNINTSVCKSVRPIEGFYRRYHNQLSLNLSIIKHSLKTPSKWIFEACQGLKLLMNQKRGRKGRGMLVKLL